MKIEEAVKRLSKITLVGEEYDAARKSLTLWKDLREALEEAKAQGKYVFIDVSRIIEFVDIYIKEIEREE